MLVHFSKSSLIYFTVIPFSDQKMSNKKKDRNPGKILDLNEHEKFLEERVKRYKEKLEAQAKSANTSKVPSASEANTARL